MITFDLSATDEQRGIGGEPDAKEFTLPDWQRGIRGYDPSQPRDESGRWSDGGGSGAGAGDSLAKQESAKKFVDEHLQMSEVAKDKAVKISAALHSVIESMSDGALDRFTTNTDRIFVKEPDDLKAWCKGRGIELKEDDQIGGVWSQTKAENKGFLTLDGPVGGYSARDIYAHEIAHAIDGHNEFSNSDEWKSAWKEEIAGGGLSSYATTDPTEGFAEYGRLRFTAGGIARREYPKCHAFWKSKGIA